MEYRIVSSNQNKLREFNRFGLPFQAIPGKDIHEVKGTPEEVVLYKALEAGPFTITEDTSFDIEGMDIGVNIRWVMEQLVHDNNSDLIGKKAKWTVLLAKNDGEYVSIYEGVIEGNIGQNTNTDEGSFGFGFDIIFYPSNSKYSLAEMDRNGTKDNFSARKNAVAELLNSNPIKIFRISDIPAWTGDYQ